MTQIMTGPRWTLINIIFLFCFVNVSCIGVGEVIFNQNEYIVEEDFEGNTIPNSFDICFTFFGEGPFENVTAQVQTMDQTATG